MLQLVKRDVPVNSLTIKKMEESLKDIKDFIKHNSLSNKKMTKQMRKLTHKSANDMHSKRVTNFIYDNLSNIMLYNEETNNYLKIKGKIGKKRLREKKIANTDFTHVLINSGKNRFHKLPYYIYKEFTKMKYLIINIECEHTPDGELEDGYDPLITRESRPIASLNQLLDYLPTVEGYIAFGNKFVERQAWFDIFDWKITVTILYKNNTVITADIRDFISSYRLYK